MRDAAAGKFDVAVVYKVDRFGRDGADIIASARTLKRDFAVDVVDTAGPFDTRDLTNPAVRFMMAGLAEQERLHILQRMMGGRVARAKAGLPWSGTRPLGRECDKDAKQWYVTEQGHTIAAILKRYAEGESFAKVAAEFGMPKAHLSQWVHTGQLAGTYDVRFQAPDIGLDETVAVPGIPEIISPALLEKVKARMAHNTTWNRTDAKQYRLSGFMYCATCGKGLIGQTMRGIEYYRHHRSGCTAGWRGVHGGKLTAAVLDYLYRFALDEPAFNKAVEAAMPSTEHRAELSRQRGTVAKRLAKTEKQIANLVAAVAKGADVSILLSRQDDLKAERTRCQADLERIDNELATMPTAEQAAEAAMWCRLELIQEHTGKDWRKLPHEKTKTFLHHLFGDNPRREGLGIFIDKAADGTITTTFKGKIDLPHTVSVVDDNGRVASPAGIKEAKRLSRKLKTNLQKAINQANQNGLRPDSALSPGR